MIDSHVHIDFERIDSELELYIKEAEKRNIEEFTITNEPDDGNGDDDPCVDTYSWCLEGGEELIQNIEDKGYGN